jgi:hypothetical protein
MPRPPIQLTVEKTAFFPVNCDGRKTSTYLRKPERVVFALFGQKSLKVIGDGHYSYSAKPFFILRWEVHPLLVFHTKNFSDSESEHPDFCLLLDSCRLAGNDSWTVIHDNLLFECDVCITSRPGGLEIHANSSATIECMGCIRMIPVVVVREVAIPVIEWVLQRLLMRCEKSVCKDIQFWLENAPVLAGN